MSAPAYLPNQQGHVVMFQSPADIAIRPVIRVYLFIHQRQEGSNLLSANHESFDLESKRFHRNHNALDNRPKSKKVTTFVEEGF